ncbi:uncharacterized protein LOC131479066 [Ochotona princeps]|uniref:uncharacterized protein LOC131479066 n=1 Tax=Ochotona princeps TaxID=9978 RepID=UPI002714AC91|nr:uncharacterized protein LOC131479066 [Ochotona princeps]
MERRTNQAFLDLGPEFRTAKCLNLCELHLILSDQLRLRPLEGRPLLKASYEYANRFAKFRTRNVIVDLRIWEREGDLHQFEIAQLVNIMPKSVEEAATLIPSLSRLPMSRLHRVLELLEVFRIHATLPRRTSDIYVSRRIRHLRIINISIVSDHYDLFNAASPSRNSADLNTVRVKVESSVT